MSTILIRFEKNRRLKGNRAANPIPSLRDGIHVHSYAITRFADADLGHYGFLICECQNEQAKCILDGHNYEWSYRGPMRWKYVHKI